MFIDWASDLTISNEVPKSTSETKTEGDDAPPPLPPKHRNPLDEPATLPRSSKVILPGENPSSEAGNHLNDNNNVDKPVALPRVKTISGGHAPSSQVGFLYPYKNLMYI